MTVTATTAREWDFYGTDDRGKKCIFPRNPINADFAAMCNFRTKNVYVNAAKYCAFPFTQKIGNSIITIFAEGDAHGQSDRHRMVRSDDGGYTYTDSVVFYENSTGAFDFSLLDGLMSTGDKIAMKVWNVTKTDSGYTVVTTSTVDNSGLTYAIWSKPKTFSDGNQYRTGYAVNGAAIQSALFTSTDEGDTWTFVSIIFSGSGLYLSESDIEEYSTNNIVTFCREDVSSDSNTMYRNYSTDLGVTWATQEAMAPADINGRQPQLRKLADGSIILGTGDRSGTSGISTAGEAVNSEEFTGVTIWRSTDGFATFSYRTPVAGIFSTDGGQPYIEETDTGRIMVAYYAARSIDAEPVIGSAILDVAFMTAAVAEPTPAPWAEKTYFIPTLYGATTAGSPVLTTAEAHAYRIGGMVHINGKITWSSLGGAAGAMKIGNLPYSCNFDNDEAVDPPLEWVNILHSSTGSGLRGYLQPDGDYINLTADGAGSNLNDATDASLTATGSIYFSGTFITEDSQAS